MRTTATPSTVGCPVGANACITQSAQATALGPVDLDQNIEALIRQNQKDLLHPEVHCTGDTYPINCTLLSYYTVQKQLLQGSVKILGIYTLTHTYAYQLAYGSPAKASASGQPKGATGASGTPGV